MTNEQRKEITEDYFILHYGIVLSSDEWEELTRKPKLQDTEKTIYFDMDGVLAKWQPKATMEEVFSLGYFENLPKNKNIVESARLLIAKGYKVRVLSKSCYTAIPEKINWLRRELPEISLEDVVLVPLEANKSDFVGNEEISLLVDDYNPNLDNWKGKRIKCITPCNHTNPKFDSVYSEHNELLITSAIEKIF